ncbi:cupredoxin domain-containing protein [Cohnella fermenti]|uniref:Cytochrome C oxidase subunit II n=1 Tax=Cohnella fermenti TaxID=2565925 RepID=A0A4V3WEA0_9BACL|nr:cupredoxin domain-containing protein [Cohnella fermenti]THF75468.1 cytochrome C oxidase subunit II [Cohnella fermenti]
MNKKSYLFMALVVIAALIALSACGNSNNNKGNNSSGSPTASGTTGGGEAVTVTVNAKNFEFDPQEIKAKVGDTLTITLNNTAGNHGFAIPDLNVNLKNGETATVTLDKAGTYEYNCSIQCGSGHDNMVGSITVS